MLYVYTGPPGDIGPFGLPGDPGIDLSGFLN